MFFLQDPAFINEVVAYAMETTVLTAARAFKVRKMFFFLFLADSR